MSTNSGWKNAPVIRFVASLWLGSVVLVMVLVALACATVYESMHGTEQALFAFYFSDWFQALLALLVIGVLVALAIRFPFSRARIGFVVTHVSIAVILAGALTTKFLGVEGQLALIEGETLNELRSNSGERLTLKNRASGTVAGVDLNPGVFGRLEAVDHPFQEGISLDGVEVKVVRYLPDAVASTNVVNDATHPQAAVEVSLSPDASSQSVWIFGGEPARVGGKLIALTMVADQAALQRRLAETPATKPAASSVGTLKVTLAEGEFEIPVESCLSDPAEIGNTNYTVRIVDYYPHASVGEGGKLFSASAEPVNPAVRVEIVGPKGPQTQLAFARFPDFSSTHGSDAADKVKITFIASGATSAPATPIEIISTPDGAMSVLFSPAGQPATSVPLRVGEPVATPWAGTKLTVSQRFDRARVVETMNIPKKLGKTRAPAVLLTVSSKGVARDVWLRKSQLQTLSLGQTPYDLIYDDRTLPLGFGVTLNKFTVGYYPGGRRPRSFESQVAITDAASGRNVNRLISMNHPTSYGGFTFYQSSYQMMGDQALSVLSVARDPGQAIVFTGYIGLLAGMLWVLVARMRQRGHVGEDRWREVTARGNGGRLIQLLTPGDRCVQTPATFETRFRGPGNGSRPMPGRGQTAGSEVRR